MPEEFRFAAPIFAFGLVAFGFLGMGPVTIAVDSFGPVTDNAQSVYELSQIESEQGHRRRDREGLRLQARLRERQAPAGEGRRRGQHLQGDRQARADRHRGRRRHDHGVRHHHAPEAPPPRHDRAPLARPSRGHDGPPDGRRGHLLVHGRQHPGRRHRRLPRGGLHQGEHEARRDDGLGRRLQGGRPDLHAVRPEGDDQHLRRRVLLRPVARVLRPVLLHRLPDRHRVLRPLPGHLHGQRRRRLGQRQEDRRGGAEAEGHARCTPRPSSATRWATRSRTPRRSR